MSTEKEREQARERGRRYRERLRNRPDYETVIKPREQYYHNKYYQLNKQRIAEQRKEVRKNWTPEQREAARQRAKKYREAHKDELNAKRRQAYKKINEDNMIRYNLKYYTKKGTPRRQPKYATRSEANRAYYQRHKEELKAKRQQRKEQLNNEKEN